MTSDKWKQKYAHCIVLCSMRTSGLYDNYLSTPVFVICVSSTFELFSLSSVS